jgi:hypothetical protein
LGKNSWGKKLGKTKVRQKKLGRKRMGSFGKKFGGKVVRKKLGKNLGKKAGETK